MNTVFICLGSNMGNRLRLLEKASEQLGKHAGCSIQNKSSVYETEPWGVTDQTYYLNQVIEIKTDLSPRELLILCHQIEAGLDRQRDHNWAPRTVDIDILLYASVQIDETDFHVPHRHLHERRFALVPLVEIAPDLFIPGHNLTAKQMLFECEDVSGVQKMELKSH